MSDFTANMHKIRFRLRIRPDRVGGAYSAPPDPLASGEGLAAPPQQPHLLSRPFGPRYSALRSSIISPRL